MCDDQNIFIFPEGRKKNLGKRVLYAAGGKINNNCGKGSEVKILFDFRAKQEEAKVTRNSTGSDSCIAGKMSARVCNPMVLSEISKLRSPAVHRRPATASNISAARVKRDLFGPVDKEDSKKFIERELAAHNEVLSKKWGFDFRAGQPINDNDQFQWERVPPTSAPGCFTGMVTLTRAAHVVPQASTSLEDMLDQKVEREHRNNCFKSLGSPASASGSDSEMDSCEAVRTYPLVLRSESLTTIASCTTTSLRSSSSLSSSFPASAKRVKRQQRITDYLQERKRIVSGAPIPSLAKKARHMLNSSSSGASAVASPALQSSSK